MSVEEKIKRAEEIYARRHEQDSRNTTTLNLNGKEKKDIKLFKKMILQIVVCLLIYLIFYTIQNNNYIFSEDFINKAKEVLSYDTNFEQLGNDINNAITYFFNNKESNDDSNAIEEKNDNINTEKKNDDGNNSAEENIGGSDEKENKESDTSDVKENKESDTSNVKENEENKYEIDISKLSEEEQQIYKVKSTTSFIKPVQGEISSRYGIRNPTTSTVPKNHTGTDIAANLGTKIISSTDGEVILASSQGDYGNHLKIKIGDVIIVYAHCNKLYVKEGEKVTQGQEIAEVGSTGNSTGPHLHFEIRFNDVTIDPEKILEL